MQNQKLINHILPLLHTAAQQRPQNVEVEASVLCDHDQGHYQIIYIGWNGDQRIYAVLLHLHIIDDKIYIERDGTADGFAQALMDAGVSRDQIVLAFHPPYKRPLTDFAAG